MQTLHSPMLHQQLLSYHYIHSYKLRTSHNTSILSPRPLIPKNMSKQQKKQSHSYSLDQLKEGDEGPIVVMICRRWDVHNINGRYLSTDFIVSDEKENVMHCTMKSNISHCFNDKVQEGSVVSMRYFTVQKKDEYRIIKDNTYLIELNGSTSIKKATVNVGYIIGYVANVGKSAQPRTGSKSLDFILAIERGRTIRVTLWGKLGDALLKKKPNNCGNYTIIPTSMSAKYYNGQLCLSSCSSTLILDNDEIPAIVVFKEKISDVDETEPSLPVVASEPQHGTIQELLALGRDKRRYAATFIIEAEIIDVRTKNSWYYPACAGGKKGVTRKDGKLWCDACDQPVNYPKPRFRLEVDVKDGSAHTVIVMWDETAMELTKSSATALLDGLNEAADDAPVLPHALTNLFNTKHMFEVKSHTYYNYGEFESFTCSTISPTPTSAISDLHEIGKASDECALDDNDNIHKSPMKRLVRGPKLCTPSKEAEPKKKEKYIEEDSDIEEVTVKKVPVDKDPEEHAE
ncbi:hypothetical protein OROHE_022031 [Orobanche hederae]